MYPNVTSIHAALDAMRQVLIEENLSASEIRKIEVGCGHMTFVHTAWEYRPAGVTACPDEHVRRAERDGAQEGRFG